MNSDLKTQFDQDPNRVLPQGDHYSLGVDGYLFMNPPDDYYHSGYWYSSFLELRYVPKISINAKIAVYHPSISYGVGSPAQIQPFVGITAEDAVEKLDLKVTIRAGDLDRQTIGAGLTFEDHEMNGVIFAVTKGPVELRALKNGTGGYVRCADVNQLNLDAFNGIIGVYHMATPVDSTCKTAQMESVSRSFLGVYSKHLFSSGVFYALEGATRNKKNAGLAKLGYQYSMDKVLKFSISHQYRKYADLFAAGYAQHIYLEYLSVEQRDKDFTNSMNIFAVDDNVRVNATKADFRLFEGNTVRAFSENEFGIFERNTTTEKIERKYSFFGTGLEPNQRFYYFHHAVEVCPNPGRDDCLSFGYADKIINTTESTREPGKEGTATYFTSTRHWRVEAKLRF